MKDYNLKILSISDRLANLEYKTYKTDNHNNFIE